MTTAVVHRAGARSRRGWQLPRCTAQHAGRERRCPSYFEAGDAYPAAYPLIRSDRLRTHRRARQIMASDNSSALRRPLCGNAGSSAVTC